MKIKSSTFLMSAQNFAQYPENALPEIALVGRSNVGKSSLLNSLISRKNLARTSSTPGKTQMINFYLINEAFYFADVPGYGFAKVSKTRRSEWQHMIALYLEKRKELQAVIQIIDMRHPPSLEDQEMFARLTKLRIPVIIAANKADKIVRGKWPKHIQIIRKELQVSSNMPIVIYSAEKKWGVEEMWKLLEIYLTQ